MERFDVIVLGLGAMGASASCAIARRGHKVLGIDRFGFGHDKGSTHGETRLTRLAYFEHPDYVPLLQKSHEQWRRCEENSGKTIFHETGLLYFGRKESAVLSGVRQSAALHSLDIQNLSTADVSRDYPAFTLREPWDAIREKTAGYLDLTAAMSAFEEMAKSHGAKFLREEPAVDWKPNGSGFEIATEKARYYADRLVLALGPWASPELLKWKLPLVVRRQTLFWFTPSKTVPEIPCYAFDFGNAFIYGFPVFQGHFKLADHTLGEVVPDPNHVERQVKREESIRVSALIEKVFPWLNPTPVKSAVCLYTMTPDSNFVIDSHPEHPGVAVACGFSGHGFKFAPVVGEALADLALSGTTTYPIPFLNGRRFGN